MKDWLRLFTEWHGKSLPDDYMVFDLETTGFKKDWDLPVSIGWCIVRERQPVQSAELVLNWTKYPQLVETDWLRGRLSKIENALTEKGEKWIYTPEYLQANGKNPLWCLNRIQQLFLINRDAGASFVGHNAGIYDRELMENVFLEYLGHKGDPFKFGTDELYDTGCIEKAVQASLAPYPDETNLADYFKRVFYNYQPGLKWNLGACVERYGLLKGQDMSAEDLHTAGTDARVTHLLFEELRRCVS